MIQLSWYGQNPARTRAMIRIANVRKTTALDIVRGRLNRLSFYVVYRDGAVLYGITAKL